MSAYITPAGSKVKKTLIQAIAFGLQCGLGTFGSLMVSGCGDENGGAVNAAGWGLWFAFIMVLISFRYWLTSYKTGVKAT